MFTKPCSEKSDFEALANARKLQHAQDVHGQFLESRAAPTTALMSVLRTAQQQALPMFETIMQLLMNAWAGKDPVTDLPADSS